MYVCIYTKTYLHILCMCRYLISTQFESTDARKSFPCLDEPSFKSTFQVSLWRKDPMVALTNTPNTTEVDA